MKKEIIEKLENVKAYELKIQGFSTKDISSKAGVSVDSVRRYLKTIDASCLRSYRTADCVDLNDCINMYHNGYTCQQIGDKYNVSRQKISELLKENNVEVKRKDLIYIEETLFDSIDTEEKAYWLGFMYADGNIDSTKKVIAVNLSEKDSDHLEKFKKFLNYSHELMHVFDGKHHKCRLSVTNHHMWDTLNSYGCTPRKSLTVKFPSEDIFKDKSLIKHFIRGYWDGDGTLTWKNKEHTRAEMGALGTENFLNTMQKYLPIGFRKIQTKHPDGALECKSYQVEDTIAFKLAFFLYEGATVYMNRKYDVFKKYCRLYEKLYRELQTNIGEGCDANTEITGEIKESPAS